MFRLFSKDWRLPTLAEPIELLPSARLCLTAVFGMGTGRTTALWPPKSGGQRSEFRGRRFNPESVLMVPTKFKRTFPKPIRGSLKTTHRDSKVTQFAS